MGLSVKTIKALGVEARQIPSYGEAHVMRIRDQISIIEIWCDGEAQLNEELLVATTQGPKLAKPGDWVVQEPDGQFNVYTNDEFMKEH